MTTNRTTPATAAGASALARTPGGILAVAWGDPSGTDNLPRLWRKLDAGHAPWALLRLAAEGPELEPRLPECRTLDAARTWLAQGRGLIWGVDAASHPVDECQPLRLANEAGADILPVYIPAGQAAEARVGSLLTPATLERLGDEQQQVQVLRWRGQALRYRPHACTEPASPEQHEAIDMPASPSALRNEIERLPAGCTLSKSGDCHVYAARANQIPLMLREIARQREVTFRAAGEGTGRALDLDEFDADYYHLFAYEAKQQELIGAYRLGLVDDLVERRGMPGLYTNTLFHFAPDLFDHLGPTIELGRSFVCPQYQRSSRALIWLWKGIACFVADRPAYRTLLGPVSVSADYGSFSRELMVRVLSGSKHRHPLYESVRARNPVLARSFGTGGLGDPRAVLSTLAELHAVVSDAEADRKGLPILLREYLKLGGKFLDFNLDQTFSNVIDGLVVVDLLQTDRRLLSFYMGKRLEQFLDHHRVSA